MNSKFKKYINESVEYGEYPKKGILRYIADKYNADNAYEPNLVDLFVDSVDPKGGPPHSIINATEYIWFGTSHSSNPHWYTIDFLSFRVSIKSYTFSLLTKHYHKSWEIMSSDDNKIWKSIDSRTMSEPPSQEINSFFLE